MVDFEEEFNVWTRDGDDEESWTHRITTNSIDTASALFVQYKGAGYGVCVYEQGSFMHKGKRKVGAVAFIWNTALNEYMGGEPEGRGRGWTDRFHTFVEYDYPGKPVCDHSSLSSYKRRGSFRRAARSAATCPCKSGRAIRIQTM